MRSGLRFMVVSALTLMVGYGCEGKTEGGTETDANTDGVPTVGAPTDGGATGTTNPATTEQGSGGGDSSGPGTGDTTAAPDTDGTTAGSSGTEGGGGGVIDCGGNVWACGDGIDNDGDGLIDLLDPECTGPCDDDEGSFQTGIPGDNMDCKQDCFFDGNSGQGDDGCNWDLRCDPANPGEFINCEYTGGNNCDNQPPNQEQGCIEFCEPFVPPGCDCFGCCEVQTPGGSVWIFLNSHPDCAFDNLEACTECTPQIEDCGNPCEPEECEVCFGETEPPEGCDGNTCPGGGDVCEATSDCPTDYFCYLGCCYPPPPG